MPRIKWLETGKKIYETGVDKGVLYPISEDGTYSKGVAWNGLTKVGENPSGAEPTALWADNVKYLNLMSAEEYGATIEAYTYPDEFTECDGSKELAPGVYAGQQDRKVFGMSHRTLLGNDTKGTKYGYKLHLIYGALAAPSGKDYGTVNDNPNAITFSWEISTTPVPVTKIEGVKATATLVINSTKTDAAKLKAFEDILYGTDDTEPRLPLPDEVITIVGTSGTTADSSEHTEPTE